MCKFASPWNSLLYIWHVLGGDVPASQGTYSGQGWHQNMAFLIRTRIVGTRDFRSPINSNANLATHVYAGKQDGFRYILTDSSLLCWNVKDRERERERFEVFYVCYINLAGKSKSICLHSPLYWGPATIQFSLDNIALISFWKITSSPLALGWGTISFQTLYLTLVWDWKHSVILSLVHFTNIHAAHTLFQTLALVLKTLINSQCLLTSDFVELTG